MKIIKCKNYDEASVEAANIIQRLVSNNPSCILGLATGSSPIGTYQNLIKAYEAKGVSFKDVITYNLDEYCGIDQDHEQSYYTFMHKNLFDYIDIEEKNIHLPYAEKGMEESCCEDYSKVLNSITVDLQVLGIGANGHIGFNEPGTPFNQQTFIVELTQQTREDNKRFFNSLQDVPTHAITMGIQNIFNAKQIVMIATGANKAEAVKKLICGVVDTSFPASILNKHDNVTLIIDEASAALLG